MMAMNLYIASDVASWGIASSNSWGSMAEGALGYSKHFESKIGAPQLSQCGLEVRFGLVKMMKKLKAFSHDRQRRAYEVRFRGYFKESKNERFLDARRKQCAAQLGNEGSQNGDAHTGKRKSVSFADIRCTYGGFFNLHTWVSSSRGTRLLKMELPQSAIDLYSTPDLGKHARSQALWLYAATAATIFCLLWNSWHLPQY